MTGKKTELIQSNLFKFALFFVVLRPWLFLFLYTATFLGGGPLFLGRSLLVFSFWVVLLFVLFGIILLHCLASHPYKLPSKKKMGKKNRANSIRFV